ncbi:hypothetical protein BOX15_Mlig027877g1, partial [Macrostomum lignano]
PCSSSGSRAFHGHFESGDQLYMYNFKQNFGSRSKDDSWDLPALSTNRTSHEKPRQQQQQQLVPIRAESLDDHRSMSSPSDNDERIRSLETRLRVAEKSNRALLEEVVRLQSELKVVSRKGEDALRDERRARQMLEGAVKSSGDLVNQLAQRLRTQEDRLAEERSRLDNLAEAGSRKEAQQARVTAMERELEALEQARTRAERQTARLLEEMRNLRARVEDHQRTGQQQQQPRARHSSAQEKLQDLDEQLPNDGGDLRREIVDLRSRVRAEAEERRRLEQRLDERLTEALKTAGTEQQPGLGATDRLALQARIQEAAEGLNQRILEKEVRLREDAARSQAEAERLILREQEARLTQEREQRHQQEQRWEALRKAQEEELAGARRAQRAELAEAAEATRALQEAVQAMERRIQELTDRDSKGGKSSEDESRLRQQLTARVQELEARLSSSSSALSAEVAELARRVRSANSAGASKNQWESLLEDYRRETGRRIAGTEEQLQAVKSRLDRMDERLGGRMGELKQKQESNDSLMKEIQERLEAISQRLGQTEGHVTDLKSKNAAVNDGVHRNSDQITALMEDLSLRVGSEIAGRVQDTDSIRVELERLKASSSVGGGDSSGLKRELEECQALVRKLAEVVQTVKTVLGMKIQSEQKLRMAELKGMQEEMKQHSGKLDQLASKVNGKK